MGAGGGGEKQGEGGGGAGGTTGNVTTVRSGFQYCYHNERCISGVLLLRNIDIIDNFDGISLNNFK